jgi:hypothetical protein
MMQTISVTRFEEQRVKRKTVVNQKERIAAGI